MLSKPTTTLSGPLNTGARFLGSINVRLEDVLKTIAVHHGFAVGGRVHDGDHLHVFVSAPPIVSISDLVRVFKCVSARCFSTSLRD